MDGIRSGTCHSRGVRGRVVRRSVGVLCIHKGNERPTHSTSIYGTGYRVYQPFTVDPLPGPETLGVKGCDTGRQGDPLLVRGTTATPFIVPVVVLFLIKNNLLKNKFFIKNY